MPFARLSAAVLAISAITLPAQAAPNWNAAVVRTPEGTHVRGNPKARVKLVEYLSYTCPHCAHFEAASDAPLRQRYIGPGKVSVEIRHFLRDPIDATVAQLANCGPKEKFFANHSAFLRGQPRWIATLAGATAAQKSRWTSGDYAARRRAIAADFGFYAIMASRGYPRAIADRCLADEPLARRLAAQTAEAARAGVRGTPSFALDGALLADTHSWDVLLPQIDARL
jgi:protein-disulfide isomerase